MSTYRVTTEDGSVYEVTTEDATPGASSLSAADSKQPSLMAKTGATFLSRLLPTPTPGSQYGPVTNALIGAGKGILHTARNIADLGSIAFPGSGINVTPRTEVAPVNTPQRIGYGLEQAAEYLIPGGVEAKGVKALDAATSTMKYAPLVRTVGRGALSALSSGGVAGLQTKDPELAAKAAATAGAVSGGMNALSEAAPSVGRGLSAIVGKTTGAGESPIQQAAKNPSPALVEQMRHPDEGEIVGNLKDALQNLKDSRASAYREQLAQLPKDTAIDPKPIEDALAQKLQQFRVTSSPPDMKIGGEVIPPELAARLQPRGTPTSVPGKLDFSASPVSEAGQKDIRKVTNLVRGWKDWSVLGADALKRRIDDMYGESKQARAFIAAMKNEVNSNIVAQVPEYAQMTGEYAKASDLLDHLSDLSLTSKNPGTAIRKITTTLNQNNEYRKGLVDVLQQYSNIDLNGQVAGLALSKLTPRGIMGPASGAGLVLGIVTGALDPTKVAGLALTSPRLMGEVAVALGKLKPLLSKAQPGVAAVAPGLAASQTVNQPRTFPQSQIQSFAQENGISPDEARKRLEAEGWQIQ